MKKLKPAQIALIIILGIYSVLSFYSSSFSKNTAKQIVCSAVIHSTFKNLDNVYGVGRLCYWKQL